MSKIITELKVDSIPLEDILQEIKKREYSSEIMIRPLSNVVCFDKTEDLVRFAEFVHLYKG